jgi:hypothetical protein
MKSKKQNDVDREKEIKFMKNAVKKSQKAGMKLVSVKIK